MPSIKPNRAEDYFDEIIFEDAVKYDAVGESVVKTFGTIKRSTQLGGRMLLFEKGTENHYYLSTKEGEVMGNSLWLSKEDDELARRYFTEYYEGELFSYKMLVSRLENTIEFVKTIKFVNKGES